MSGFEQLLIGRVVGGHYRVEEVLGDGGFGVVFRAADLREGRAERVVALKVLKVPVRAAEEELVRLRARFRREASYAARLPAHAGIVPIYDYGTDPALDRDYLVMELLEGEDLRARLARPEPVPLAPALRILRDAARALAVGHQEGLIHRDVKPGNLFLARGAVGEEPRVRVLDFGIAKPLRYDPEDTATHVTRDGRAPLSARYAAPEQLRGEEPTRAVDVFALGVVGWEILAHARLFSEADQSRREIGLPVPVPSLRARNPEVPDAVEAVLLRALSDAPGDRFPDAGAFARALQRACRGAGVALDAAPERTDPTGERAAPAEPPPVEPTGTMAAEEETVAATAPDAPLPGVRRWGRVRLPRRAAVAAGVVLLLGGGTLAAEASAGFVRGLFPSAQERAARAQEANREGLRLFGRREYGAALGYFREATGRAPEHPEYRNNYGYTLYRLKRADEAVRVLEEVVARYPERQVAYANLADAYLLRGDTARAVAALEHLLLLDPPPGRRSSAEWVLTRLARAGWTGEHLEFEEP